MTTENQGPPPGKQNPASSLPQQEKRWTVVQSQEWLNRTDIMEGSNVIAKALWPNVAHRIVAAVNATLSEPKPKVKFPVVCTNCWRVQEDRVGGLCSACKALALQPVILGISGAPADNAQAVLQNALLPCPFCGGLPHTWSVSMREWAICMTQGCPAFNNQVPIHIWNQRVAPSVVAGVGEHAIGVSDAEIAQFLKEFDEGKHPLGAEYKAALDQARPELLRQLKLILEAGVLSDEEIARGLVDEIENYLSNNSLIFAAFGTLDRKKITGKAITAIRKAKSLSEPKERN